MGAVVLPADCPSKLTTLTVANFDSLLIAG
jgi:hypothetical protein